MARLAVLATVALARAQSCVDDPSGILAGAGSPPCSLLKNMGCATELSTLSPLAPPGLTIQSMCPLSCGTCGGMIQPFANWPVKAPELACDARVGLSAATLLSGAVPTWLSGELLHVAVRHARLECSPTDSNARLLPRPLTRPLPRSLTTLMQRTASSGAASSAASLLPVLPPQPLLALPFPAPGLQDDPGVCSRFAPISISRNFPGDDDVASSNKSEAESQ